MTTVTEPPLITPAIDVAELPALDQPDERACDLPVRHGDGWVECGRRAAWIAVVACGCGERISHAVCERVVTGTREVTKTVPDPSVDVPLVEVTETVEDVEWQCMPLLAGRPAVSA